MTKINSRTAILAVFSAVVGAVLVGGAWFATYTLHTNPTIATVGGKAIKRADLLQKTEKSAGLQTLQTMITDQLVTDAAAKQKLTASSKEVDDALSQLEAQYQISSDAQLQAMLAQSNATLSDLKKELKVQVLAQKLAEQGVTVSDKEIQDYYNQNKAQLATPETVTVSRIQVKSKADAQTVEDHLKKGEKFADLATKYSTDTLTKDQGGSMGTISKGQTDPTFEKVAFGLKPGTYSTPFQDADGTWTIVQVTDHQAAKTPTVAEAKSQITDAIKQSKAKPINQLLTDLMKQEKVNIVDPAYQSVISMIGSTSSAG